MPQQVVRLGVVFGAMIAALLAARHYLVPKTFGQIGHYRAAAVDMIASAKVKYAGREECSEACHPGPAGKNPRGNHREVSCEVCHEAAGAHPSDPYAKEPLEKLKKRREDLTTRTGVLRKLCVLCHAYDPGRPTGFPQIDPAAHNPAKPCMGCHNPHAPETPRPPDSCGACHGLIGRTHVVSSHASIPCTQCHETPKEHRTQPHLSRASKPERREFCGQCHARDARGSKEAPRIDLATHGERNVCWQCHYPHFPEAK